MLADILGRPTYRATLMMAAALLMGLVALGVASGPARSDSFGTHTLSLRVSSGAINSGGTVQLSGELIKGNGQGDPLERVILERKPSSASTDEFEPLVNQPVGGVLTGLDGSFRLAGVAPSRNTDYRARFVKSGRVEATSEIKSVGVRVLLQQSLRGNRIALGKSVVVRGVVAPARIGAVRLEFRRNGEMVSRTARLNNSRYFMQFKPAKKGRYSVTASYAGGGDMLGNSSNASIFWVR